MSWYYYLFHIEPVFDIQFDLWSLRSRKYNCFIWVLMNVYCTKAHFMRFVSWWQWENKDRKRIVPYYSFEGFIDLHFHMEIIEDDRSKIMAIVPWISNEATRIFVMCSYKLVKSQFLLIEVMDLMTLKCSCGSFLRPASGNLWW